MEAIIREIKRSMIVNGVDVEDIDSLINGIKNGEKVKIQLKAEEVQNETNHQEGLTEEPTKRIDANQLRVNHTYIIKVRQYMTKPSSPEFDFQSKWNKNEPMPFRIMQGRVLKETRGMVMMDCYAVPLKVDVCMRCGRTLTHPVSRLYGIGPECGGHAHINPFTTEDELYAALDVVKANLSKIRWQGWIIKSAIEQCQEVNL